MRRFRVDRVLSVRPTGKTVARPDGDGTPDAGADGDASAGQRPADVGEAAFVPGPDATVARVAVDDAGRWLIDAFPHLGIDSLPDGRTVITLAVASPVWFDRLLLRLGPHAEVLDPPELVASGRRLPPSACSTVTGPVH